MSKQDHPDWFLDVSVKNGKREPHDRRPGADNSRADIIGPRVGDGDKAVQRAAEFFEKECLGGCGTVFNNRYRGTTGYCRPCANSVAKVGVAEQEERDERIAKMGAD